MRNFYVNRTTKNEESRGSKLNTAFFNIYRRVKAFLWVCCIARQLSGSSFIDLFLGIALYWAEGTKEKEHRSGSGVQFANSDVLMIQLFLLWLTNVCHVPPEDISLVLYIHVNQDNRIGKIKEFWFKNTGYRLKSVYFKKHTIKTVRKNTGDTYQGTAVINVKKSSTLNRQIAGWVQGIVKNVPTS